MSVPGQIARRRPTGFSLVEILVVITIIALLMTFGFGAMQNAMEAGRVTACQDNLRQIGQSMITYKNMLTKGRWPKEGGVRFLLTLYRDKQITGRAAECFICPGTPNVYNDEGPSGLPGSSYDDWDAITSDTISYAGRDIENYPIRGSDDAAEVIASDDNEYGPNHKTATNILYGDASVVRFDLPVQGRAYLDEYPELEQTGLIVGPDSPHPDLQKLRID
ncbi:MAG: type II secretion system protein [Planctomycetes bacterium]|nr:type II secretion system protein [Planctomycetota bacterium]